MGYRSSVVMQIQADGKNTRLFKEFIGKIKLAHEEFLNEWNESDYGWNEHTFTFYVDDVKWYGSYPEVQRAEDLWAMARDMDGLSGKFMRIGEEDADIETEVFGNDWPDVYVVRDINFDGSMLGERRTADAQEQTEQAQATIKEGETANL